jgi:hypothetical protein
MKKIPLLIFIILISCNSKITEKVGQKGEVITYEKPKITGEKYFDYDEIVHYKNEIEEEKIGDLVDNQKKSKIDSLKMGIILGRIPTKITGEDFLKQLESIGYVKNTVDPKKFEKIDEIFIEKKHEFVVASACVYVYRDILIFKKKSKVVGIAKICFGCGDSIIIGTKSNTEEFGQSGDYWHLEKLLYNK